jgi:hypothetical protein
MTRVWAPAWLLAGMAVGGTAHAQALQAEGYLDLRLVAADDGADDRWTEGGLGKTRFGDGDAFSGSGAIVVRWQPTAELLASAEAQYVPAARKPLDLLEGWLRYRPVSTTPWRWSARVGAFFPPISLENDGLGWTSTRTLTPSAINTWVGEELRTVGAEVRVERRGARGTLTTTAALFQKNDPAGELLAMRGWALHDIASGFDGSLREPDVLAPIVGDTPPVRFRPFLEIDHRVGAYVGIDWQTPAQDRLAALYYDNRADPAAEVDYAGRELYAWHTRFWSLGAQKRFGDVLVMAQAMAGGTAFEPVPGLLLDTRFHAGYVLAGWERGEWQPTLRLDLFGARQLPEGRPAPLDEHGRALTLALNWRPQPRLRITGELLYVDSTRDQRRRAGIDPRQDSLQAQASVRWFW